MSASGENRIISARKISACSSLWDTCAAPEERSGTAGVPQVSGSVYLSPSGGPSSSRSANSVTCSPGTSSSRLHSGRMCPAFSLKCHRMNRRSKLFLPPKEVLPHDEPSLHVVEEGARELLELHHYTVRIVPVGFNKHSPPAHLVASREPDETRYIRIRKISHQSPPSKTIQSACRMRSRPIP